ncbi:YjbH domain-containing protein [Variovorax sp. J22R133]|uniref:YjbH domain-containing protein n=1 Tax=Variovorax brevis TaxID=3053503 RepID=UPI00257625FF|nr:YjbH domain-containing protein [Variovorax sp. J22R133]MDM0110722.1 YjbH domain-containing protein [Variovorax sp. J22R133]
MALLALAAPPALAQQQPTAVLSASGFTGLSVTPTAQLLRWGTMGLAYGNDVVGAPVSRFYDTGGSNFVAGFGLLPNLEVTGRLAANTMSVNCYIEPCGVRDLSFNFKAGIALDDPRRWNVAVGATDLGGAATFFRTAYGVVTYTAGSQRELDLSAGYAQRSESNPRRASTPLDGPFASAAYRPWSWLQGQVEYVDKHAWAGARVFAPAGWLPDGWAAHLGANFRVYGDERTARSWYDIGLTVPLYKVSTERTASAASAAASTRSAPGAMVSAPAPAPVAPAREFSSAGLPVSAPLIVPVAQAVAPAASTGASASDNQPATQAARVGDAQLRKLADALVAKGFEDVSVGRLSDGAVAVQINNATYNVNTADGLGVALGVVARQLADARVGYRLVLTQRQLAIVGARGQTDCLAQWIAYEKPACTAASFFTPGTSEIGASLDGADWIVKGTAPSWATARLIVQPVLRTSLGTEYGVFDYSVGVRATVQQPLWKGAYAEVSHVSPIAESDDFRDGKVFSASRIVDATDRILMHQVARLPVEALFGQGNQDAATRWGANAFTAHVAAGRFDSNYRGGYGELRWEPGEGAHRFGVEGGRFERTTEYDRFLPIESRALLGSYRFAYMPTHTYFEASAGQFMYNDRGVKVGIKQWFHDVAVSLYVRRTKFEWEPDARNFAGIEISFPLTPRKDMSPTHHIQVTGSPRWSYGVETAVGGGANYVTTGQGVTPNASVLDKTFNSDRANVRYFEENVPRIRTAASR